MKIKFIIIPGSILKNPGLTASQKLVFAILQFRQGKNGRCYPSLETIAGDLGISRTAAIRAVSGLEAAGLIKVERRYRQSNIYRVDTRHDEYWLRIESAALTAPITPAAKLIFSYLTFRVGANSEAWQHQKTIAADLGISKRTVIRIIASLEKASYIQVGHVHGGRKRSNKYRITGKIFNSLVLSPQSDYRVTKRDSKSNTLKEVKRKSPEKLFQRPLSTPADLAYRRLTWSGVHPKVASSIAYDQAHPPEAIEAAIENAAVREKSARDQGKAFARAGYIIASLNKARSECHTVKRSPAARQERQRIQILTENVKQSKCRIIPESEKQQKLEAMKTALYAAEKIAV